MTANELIFAEEFLEIVSATPGFEILWLKFSRGNLGNADPNSLEQKKRLVANPKFQKLERSLLTLVTDTRGSTVSATARQNKQLTVTTQEAMGDFFEILEKVADGEKNGLSVENILEGTAAAGLAAAWWFPPAGLATFSIAMITKFGVSTATTFGWRESKEQRWSRMYSEVRAGRQYSYLHPYAGAQPLLALKAKVTNFE